MFKKIIILFILLIFTYGAYAMSNKPCLFSGMTGVVKYQGEPAANVRLLRKIEDKDIDETTTDENGYFEFSPVYQEKSLLGFLPVEFAIKQDIIAFKSGKEYGLWSAVKRSKKANSESRGKPLVVTCELTLPERNYITVENGPIFSLCTWDVEADPKPEYTSPFDE
jgi:hypothetical protein